MLPISPAVSSAGDWQLQIEPVTGDRPVPFHLVVMGDDSAMNSNMTVVGADYHSGDTIRLRASVRELGEAVVGLNSQPGAKMLVQMIRPGASVGDLLSDSTLNPTQPSPQDTQSAAALRLEAILANDPNALKPIAAPLTLLDNGNPANGDDVAGDGIYSAVFPAQLVGHYNFIFGLEGTSRLGRFSRQHRQTVFVRAAPAASTTEFSSTIARGTLFIQMTPRTTAGNRMGPGFANYFWFTAPGITPVKPVDNGNGTYTASINVSTGVPSPISFHFINDLVRLFDDVTPDKLPSPLNAGNTVVSSVPVNAGDFKRWGLSLHGGVSFPHDDLDDSFKPGPNFTVDLEYRFNKTFSAELIYGFHHFPGETFGGLFTVDDLNVHQLSVNGKLYGSTSPVRPFFNFGGGAYWFQPGATVRGGLNFGGGVQFDVKPNIAVEGSYNFHNIFFSGVDARFSTVQAGVRFRF
jgi:hypothetical protein